MRRSTFGSFAALTLTLAGCDSAPTDPGLGPDGQAIPTTCEESNTATLQIGETAEFLGPHARFFCIHGDDDSQLDYVMTVHAAGTSAVTVGADVNGTVAPRSSPSPVPTQEVRSPSGPDDAFHIALREREVRELSGLIGATRSPGDLAPAAPAAVPFVGDMLVLNAQANTGGLSDGACGIPLHVTARVEVVSARAIVVADVANPGGGFTTSDYQRYAAQFDTLLAPLAEAHFGPATDIDANGRTILLFTREVNRLTPRNASSFTAGFFFARDLFPRQRSADGRFGGCTHSNEAEILYLLVPDPSGTINGNVRLRTEVDRFTPATIIHEYQHLTNAGRRLHVNRLSSEFWAEEPWLNEGLSHVAEELLFFRESGLAPRTNIGRNALAFGGFRASLALERHQLNNFLRFFDFLERPESRGPYDVTVTLETRGAAWSFLRYLADRSPNEAAFLFDLVDSRIRGLANLVEVLGGSAVLFDRLSDWRIAIYGDGRVFGLAERHRDLSWDLNSIHGQLGSGRYPIRSVTMSSGVAVDRTLVPGGAAYLRFAAEPGVTATVDLVSNGTLPPGTFRATVLRTR